MACGAARCVGCSFGKIYFWGTVVYLICKTFINVKMSLVFFQSFGVTLAYGRLIKLHESFMHHWLVIGNTILFSPFPGKNCRLSITLHYPTCSRPSIAICHTGYGHG